MLINIDIDVIDTGTGIPKEHLQLLFDPETHHSTLGTVQEKGSGLGLVLCKTLVETNHGQISVESTPGKGSKISITLPTVALVP